MFEFIDNQLIRTIVELGFAILTAILGFLGGIKYEKNVNKIGNINNSSIRDIKQENK